MRCLSLCRHTPQPVSPASSLKDAPRNSNAWESPPKSPKSPTTLSPDGKPSKELRPITPVKTTRPSTPGSGSRSQRHLILNFDVNKTIVMMDSVTNKNMEHILNEVLACAVWGEEVKGAWVCKSESPTVQPLRSGLISYYQFVEKQNPGPKNKLMRDAKCGTFTDPGQPGAHLQDVHGHLTKQLLLPADVVGTKGAIGVGLESRFTFIIPAFFQLLIHLKELGRSFSLVFRTFGNELKQVETEFNAFCTGSHPCFPGVVMDGSDGKADMRMDLTNPEKFGTFYRARDGITLVMGTLEQPAGDPPGLQMYFNDENDIETLDQNGRGVKKVYNFIYDKHPGVDNISDWFEEHAGPSKPQTLALRDYFPYWREQGMVGEAGKLLPIDTAQYNAEPGQTLGSHHIFIDDNIRYSQAKIVDVRDKANPQKKYDIKHLMRTHVIRAEPLHSITEGTYFIERIRKLESDFAKQNKTLGRVSSFFGDRMGRNNGHLSTVSGDAGALENLRDLDWQSDQF